MIVDKEAAFPLEDLPDGVVNKIVREHLGPLEYMRFRCASRSCQSVAPSKPWLIVTPGIVSYEILPFFVLDPTIVGEPRCLSYNRRVPRFKEFLDFKHSWVLVAEYAGELKSFSLYNPITNDVIHFPDVKADGASFLSCHWSPELQVVAQRSDAADLVAEPLNNRNGIIEWEEFSWSTSKIILDERIIAGEGSHVILYSVNSLNWNKLDVARECWDPISSYTETVVKVKTPPDVEPCDQKYFVACDGYKLLAVVIGEAGKWIKVFKLNGSGTEWEWEEVRDLGNNCLFISKMSCFAMNSEIHDHAQLKNRIYFSRYYKEGSVVYYSMKACKLHYSWFGKEGGVDESLDGFDQTEDYEYSSWFEPMLHSQQRPTDLTCCVILSHPGGPQLAFLRNFGNI